MPAKALEIEKYQKIMFHMKSIIDGGIPAANNESDLLLVLWAFAGGENTDDALRNCRQSLQQAIAVSGLTGCNIHEVFQFWFERARLHDMEWRAWQNIPPDLLSKIVASLLSKLDRELSKEDGLPRDDFCLKTGIRLSPEDPVSFRGTGHPHG